MNPTYTQHDTWDHSEMREAYLNGDCAYTFFTDQTARQRIVGLNFQELLITARIQPGIIGRIFYEQVFNLGDDLLLREWGGELKQQVESVRQQFFNTATLLTENPQNSQHQSDLREILEHRPIDAILEPTMTALTGTACFLAKETDPTVAQEYVEKTMRAIMTGFYGELTEKEEAVLNANVNFILHRANTALDL